MILLQGMKQNAKLVCINPACKKEFKIKSFQIRCDKCDFLLDVEYAEKPPSELKETFYERRNKTHLFVRFGQWYI